jgi:hypothetical protein
LRHRKLGSARFGFLEDFLVFLLVLVKEIGNIQERVPVKANIDERRLHARENAVNAALVNATYQADVRIALEIHLYQLVVFQHCDLRLVWRRGNIHLLRHGNSFFRNAGESTRHAGISQRRS